MKLRTASLSGLVLAALALLPQRAISQQSPRPLTLEQVLRSVVERHPLVEAAEARLRGARGARSTARALPNPVFTYQVENAAFPGGATPVGLDRETSVLATLPLEPLWQRWSRTSRAGAEVRAADAELALARRDVVLGAARAFYRVALAQVSVRGAADIEESLDSLVRFNRTRVAEGVAAEGDLIRVEVERDRAMTERALQEAELARARAELLPFLGDTQRPSATLASFVVAVDDSVMGSGAVLPPEGELTARALTSRPDVVAARARARAAGSETGYQRALLVRQLGLTFGAKTTGGVRSMVAGLSLPIPLFDQNRGEIGRAAGERTAAERELAWTELRASAEVAGAYEAARVLGEQVSRLKGSFLSRAEESRRVALAAYQEGAAPLFQVIDATRTLAEARLTYYRAQFAEREGLFELYAASGLDLLAPFTTETPTPGTSAQAAPTGVIR